MFSHFGNFCCTSLHKCNRYSRKMHFVRGTRNEFTLHLLKNYFCTFGKWNAMAVLMQSSNVITTRIRVCIPLGNIQLQEYWTCQKECHHILRKWNIILMWCVAHYWTPKPILIKLSSICWTKMSLHIGQSNASLLWCVAYFWMCIHCVFVNQGHVSDGHFTKSYSLGWKETNYKWA